MITPLRGPEHTLSGDREHMAGTQRSYRSILRLLQAGVSLALILWLLANISWREVLAVLVQADLLTMMAACALYYVGVALSCWKWAIALRVEAIWAPFSRLFRWYLIGAFVNNFLPTDVGGDLGRGFYARRFTGQTGAVARSIIAERATGLLAMAVLASASLTFINWRIPVEILMIATFLTLAVTVAALAGRSRLPFLMGILNKMRESGARYVQAPGLLTMMLVLSFAFQSLAGVGVWLNMVAVGINLSLITVVLVTALVGLSGLLPISINGWGVREALIVTLLTPFGTPPDRLLAAALLGRFLLLIVTLAGGILLIFEQRISFACTGKDELA